MDRRTDSYDAKLWRLQALAPDFKQEDVWPLPVEGDAADFGRLVKIMTSGGDPLVSGPLPARLLWQARDRLGALLGIGRVSAPADDSTECSADASLSRRLPADLRGSVTDVHFESVPFVPIYRTSDEFAAELMNSSVHAVMHLAWVRQDNGRFAGFMGVYVKPNGPLGRAYMAFIRPFRHLIVYPTLIDRIEKSWQRRSPPPSVTKDGSVPPDGQAR
jgi:Protein of unknown function (DUF2867)